MQVWTTPRARAAIGGPILDRRTHSSVVSLQRTTIVSPRAGHANPAAIAKIRSRAAVVGHESLIGARSGLYMGGRRGWPTRAALAAARVRIGLAEHDMSGGHRLVIPLGVGVDRRRAGDRVVVDEPADPRPAGPEADLE